MCGCADGLILQWSDGLMLRWFDIQYSLLDIRYSNVSQLADGVYFIQLYSKQKKYAAKVVINR